MVGGIDRRSRRTSRRRHVCAQVSVHVRVCGGLGDWRLYTNQEEECSYAHLFLYWT